MIQIGIECNTELSKILFRKNCSVIGINKNKSLLITEKAIYTPNEDKILINKNLSFSERVKEGLSKIEEDYVIILLDDMLIVNANNLEKIYELVNCYSPQYIALAADPPQIGRLAWSSFFTITTISSPYRFTTQTSLWQTKFAEKVFSEKFTPHELELHGGVWFEKYKPLTFACNKAIFKTSEFIKKGKIRPILMKIHGIKSVNIEKISFLSDLKIIMKATLNKLIWYLWRL